jgi:hypothetical protein
MHQHLPAFASAPSQAGVRVFWLGLFLQLSAVIGLTGTVLSMEEVFNALPKPPAMGSVDAFCVAYGHALESTFIGWIGNNLGVLLCLFALWHYHLRRKWMFWTSIVLSLLVMPCGLFLLAYCLVQWHYFFPRPIKIALG